MLSMSVSRLFLSPTLSSVPVFLTDEQPALRASIKDSRTNRECKMLTEFKRPGTRSRLYNSTGFFFLTWAAHYIPFYIMGRQLFLHHYLPAHLASALVTGALIEFIFNIEPVDPESPPPSAGQVKGHRRTRSRPVRERVATQSLLGSWIATIVVLAAVLWCFLFFAPLTYGKPGLTVEQVNARKWLAYDLHFAK